MICCCFSSQSNDDMGYEMPVVGGVCLFFRYFLSDNLQMLVSMIQLLQFSLENCHSLGNIPNLNIFRHSPPPTARPCFPLCSRRIEANNVLFSISMKLWSTHHSRYRFTCLILSNFHISYLVAFYSLLILTADCER